MTKKELQQICNWTRKNEGAINIFSELFDEDIIINFVFDNWKNEGYKISDHFSKKIDELPALSLQIKNCLPLLIEQKMEIQEMNQYFRDLHPNFKNYFGSSVIAITKEPAPITEKMMADFKLITSYSSYNSTKIKEILFNDCEVCCSSTTYGDLDIDVNWDDGETEAEANMRFFGVTNKEEAFKESNLESIIISENQSVIVFSTPWNDWCEILIQNGKLI